MSKLTYAIAAIGMVLASAPAAAATFDVGDTTPGNPFSYAQYNGGNSFTAFTAGCGARPDLPTPCFEGPQGSGSSQLVFDAGSFLLAHPGTTAAATTAVLFTAPTSSTYLFNVVASLLDPASPGTDGVSLAGYLSPFGAAQFAPLLPPVGSASGTQSFTGSLFLTAGQQIGVVFGNNGNNNNDSVGLSGTVASVPEPATWAMMIGGVGAIGAGLRRRRRMGTPALA